jgi:hypothetical protein
MIDLLRFIRHEPLMGVIVIACILIVGGVMLSDWFEKRRTRELLKIRDELKRRNLAELHGQESDEPVVSARFSPPNQPFRIFRWEFAFLTMVGVALWLPTRQMPVHAKARSTETAASVQTIESSPSSFELSTIPSLTSLALAPSSPPALAQSLDLRIPGELTGNPFEWTLSPYGEAWSQANASAYNLDVTVLYALTSESDAFDPVQNVLALTSPEIQAAGPNLLAPQAPARRTPFVRR